MIKKCKLVVSLGLAIGLLLTSTIGAFAQSGTSTTVKTKMIPVVLSYDQATNTVSMGDNDVLDYKPIMMIDDPACAIEAMGLADTLDGAVEVRPDNTAYFNFQKATDIAKATKGLSIVGILNSNITKGNANYVEMSDAVAQTILSVLKARIDNDTKTAFRNLIEQCYTNTQKDEQKGWVIWSKNTEHQSQYIYQLLFAIQNKNTGAFIYALPLALTVTVDKSKTKFFGITVQDKNNYSCNIQGLQIVKLMDKYMNGGR